MRQALGGSVWTAVCLTFLQAGLAGADTPSTGQEPGDEVEAWVRAVHFDGLPVEVARSLDDAAGERLAALLDETDPAAVSAHSNAALALGICGCGPAFDALERFAARERSGQLERAELRAWRVVPNAMAHLASVDPRALAWLEREAGREIAPAFRSAQRGAVDLARERRHAAIDSLALVGTSQADALLQQLERSPDASDPALARRLARARVRCARVGALGVDVLRGPQRGAGAPQ